MYLSLRGVSFGEIVGALGEADYRLLLPLFLTVMLSHFLRALRWKILLDVLPERLEKRPERPVSTLTAFYSLLIGYMVNYAAPRMGEVARSANLASQEKLSFSGVLGAVVVERILDVVVLALSLLSVGFLLRRQAATLDRLFWQPVASLFGSVPAVVYIGASAVALLAALAAWRVLARRRAGSWGAKFQALAGQFGAGLSTLTRTGRPAALLLTTVGIWACYHLMAYLPLVMLGSTNAFNVSYLDAWSIMILGAVGVLIPSPGGVGSYHYITIQAMVHLFGVSQQAAATYAVLSHAAQLILLTAGGFLSLLLQGGTLRGLKPPDKADGA